MKNSLFSHSLVRRVYICFVLTVHALLIASNIMTTSPTFDENANLSAGIWSIEQRDFSHYSVNPPLVRVVATVPIKLLHDPKTDWRRATGKPLHRPEWNAGEDFARVNGADALKFLRYARFTCLPFAILGGLICYQLSKEMFGRDAGLLALTLWCFSPNVIGLAAVMSTDLAAATFGILAHYTFFKWRTLSSWSTAIPAGFCLGLAELSKFSWFFLFFLWPVMWLVAVNWKSRTLKREFVQLTAILTLALFTMNACYLFDGSGQQLHQYTFYSQTLAGNDSILQGNNGGNRFSNSLLGKIPVPLPKDYLSGMDLQKIDFEKGVLCYLLGEWKAGGWWYWYFVAFAVKVPIGTLALVGAAVISFTTLLLRMKTPDRIGTNVFLLAPPMILFVIASSNTGMTSMFRYLLPILPFLFIWGSQYASSNHRIIRYLTWTACFASVCSSLMVYPHSLSYFNEFCGGPKYGDRVLVGANIDWGQDAQLLCDWIEQQDQNVYVAIRTPASLPSNVDFPPSAPPEGLFLSPERARSFGPYPGWYAISVDILNRHNGRLSYLKGLEPVERIGYSIRIFHLSLEETNKLRSSLNLPSFEPK